MSLQLKAAAFMASAPENPPEPAESFRYRGSQWMKTEEEAGGRKEKWRRMMRKKERAGWKEEKE